MKIAIVADKKLGHLTQCLGLREIVKEYKRDKHIFYIHKDIIALPGFLERIFLLIKDSLYLLLLRLLNPSLVEEKFNLVICSGSRTVFPAYLLAQCTGAKIVYLGTPKHRIMKKFDGIISTKKDISKVYKVISTELPPTKFKPYETISKSKKDCLVLLGGDGSGYDYGEKDWYRLAYEFKPLKTTFLNSRRTPEYAWKNLKENKGIDHRFIDHQDAPFEVLQNALDTHALLFVTADSTSMIVEIISRGYFVNVIELRGPIKREHHHDMIDSFEKKKLLRKVSLSELNQSRNKDDNNVREFVLSEREGLKNQINRLI